MSSNKPQIFIIIVNYNNTQDTIACLHSLGNLKPQNYSYTPLLIDNGSQVSVVEKIKDEFPQLKIIRSSKNLGFAGGNNLGLKQALKKEADYLFLINNDTLIKDPALIDQLLATSADIISPVVKFEKAGKIFYDFGGKVDWLFARNIHLETSQFKPPSQTPDYLSGVSLFVKSSVFKKIGLFDDRFFLYYEDADFCLRAQKAGFTLQPCYSTTIFHQLSQSADKLGSQKLKILADSQWLFARKHLSYPVLPLAFLYHQYLLLKARLNLGS